MVGESCPVIRFNSVVFPDPDSCDHSHLATLDGQTDVGQGLHLLAHRLKLLPHPTRLERGHQIVPRIEVIGETTAERQAG